MVVAVAEFGMGADVGRYYGADAHVSLSEVAIVVEVVIEVWVLK